MNWIHQFLISSLFLGFSVGASALPVEGTLLSISSVTVPSSDTDGDYNVVIDSAPEVNPDGWIELQEQKDGGSYSTIDDWIVGGSYVPVSDRYTAVYRYRAKRCLGLENTRCTGWVYSGNVSVVRTPDRPAAPSSGVKSTSGTVNVTWSKPAGVVSDYDLQKRLGSGSWTSAGSNLTSKSKSVTGLGNGNWTFRVRACDDYSGTCSAYSPASGINYVRYKPSAPAAPSSGVKSTSGSVPVSWSKPSGSVTYYDLQKRLGSGSWSNAITGTSSTSGSPSLADGNWTFRVRACNGYSWACSGYSGASGVNYVRRPPSTPAAPSPVAHNTSGSVPVTWSKPSGTVSYYDLQKRLNTGSWANAITGTSATSGTPGSLAEGNWTFKVRACNEYSWACSAYSSVSSIGYVRIKPPVPSAPVVPSKTTNQSITANFGAATGSGKYYKLLSRKGSSGSFTEHSPGSHVTSATTTAGGLTDGSWYFEVSHCNEFDWACSTSGASSSVNARRMPQSVSLSLPGESRPRRSYDAGFSSSTTVTAWTLKERKAGTSAWSTAYQGSAGSKSFTKTVPEESWEYQLTACNTSVACYTTGVATIDINPWVIGDIANAALAAPPVPSNDPTVGQLNPEVSVNGGTVDMNIPIVVPPGRAGVQPGVSLKYSSSSSNGLLGLGGSLAAGGAIRRCADIFELDGTGGSVTDDAADKLCLNGERLVLANSSSTYGAGGSVYYPETKPQLKVTQSGALASATFAVHHSDGAVDYYGDTANSQVSRNSVRIAWKLRKTEDFHGNSIIYSYTAFEGGSNLSNIYYTGNGDTAGNRRVELKYESRNDVQISYRNGSRKVLDKRLQQVRTYVGGSPVRDYDIAYFPNTTDSKVQDVTLCAWNTAGSQRQCYPATSFVWDNWQPGISNTPVKTETFSVGTISGWDEGVNGGFDYDGDGIPDLVYGEGHDNYVKLSTTGNSELLPFASRSDGGGYNQSKSFVNTGVDFNLNGQVDFAGFQNSSGYVRYASWNGSNFSVVQTDISYDCVDGPYDITPNDPGHDSFRACSAYSLDFNGDGIQDVVTTYQEYSSTVYLKFYQGKNDGSFTYLGISDAIFIDSPLMVTDFDGDGNQDLLGINKSALPSSAYNIVSISVNWSGNKFQSIGVNEVGIEVYKDYTPIYLDANTDGLIDVLVYSPQDLDWRLHINTGGNLTSESYLVGWNDKLQQRTVVPSTGDPYYRFMHGFVRTVDYNGDGITDLVIPNEIEYPNSCAVPCAADGDGDLKDQMDLYSWKVVLGTLGSDGKISYDNEISIPVIAPLTDLNIVDENRDGYPDFATRLGRMAFTSLAMTGPYANQPGIYVYYNQSSKTDQIKSVTTGLGVKHEFEYAMLGSNSNFYSVSSTTRAYPNVNGSTNMRAVKEYRTSDGLGGLNKTTFSYRDLLFNLKGRGSQGFGTITENKYASTSDSQPYARVITTFSQAGFPKSGSISRQQTQVRDGGAWVTTADVDNHLTEVSGQLADTKFVYADTSTTKKYELTGSLISTQTLTPIYNYLGLLTDSTSEVSDSSGDVTKTTIKDINFNLDTSNWWFKLNNSSERHKISYGDPLQLPGDALTDVTVTKTYEYNDSGTRQPTKVTTTSNDTSLNLISTNRYSGPLKQLDRVTITSNGSGNTAIEGSRWTQMAYSTGSDNGYFVAKTYNSAWGTGVPANDATYDARTGQPLTQKDANGHTTTNQYDRFGHLTETDAPGVPAQQLSRQWCDSGCPAAANNRHAVYFEIAAQAGAPMVLTYYDALGREVYREAEGTNGTTVQWQTYDKRGRVTQAVDPHYSGAAASSYGTVDYSQFDALNRPGHKSVSRLPISYQVNYDYSGLSTDITVTPDGLGPVLMMASRSTVLGQPLYHQDAKGQYTRFRYDALGNVAMIQDVAGNAITASYNGLGHKVALSDPNMGNWQFAYNALGELRWQQDAKGQVTTFNYDALGRLTDKYPGSDPAKHFQFDDSGYGTLDREYTGASGDPDFERIYSYDSLQRETARTTQIDGNVFVQKTAWDGNYGRVKGVQYPDGTLVETRYDDTGRVAEDWDFVAGIKLRSVDSRNASDSITQQHLASDLMVETSQFSAAGLLQARCTIGVAGNCDVSDLVYDQYDSYGNLKHRRNNIAKVDESFTYDNLHRLIQSSRSWDTHIPGTLHATVDYGYDAVGNLLYKTDFSADSPNAYQYGDSGRSTDNAGPNAVTQVTLEDQSTRSYHYDLNGNLTADGLRTISYGVNNKPGTISHSNGNSAAFYYGSDDSRYKQVATDGSATTTRYYLGAYEYEKTQDGANLTVTERTTVADFAQYRTETLNGSVQSSEWQFLHKDRLGSIESVSNIAGTVKERRGFDPFGKARDLNEDDSNGGLLNRTTTKRGFTNHEHLDGVELIHMNGRAYDYNLGRFLSVDPFISMPANSQAYNPYSYVMNNPMRYTDPTGYLLNLPNERYADHSGGGKGTQNLTVPQKQELDCLKRSNCKIFEPSPWLAKILKNTGNGASTKIGEGGASKSQEQQASGQSGDSTITAGTYDPDIGRETLKTIGNAATQAIGNLIPDIVNGVAGWTERFVHSEPGSFGRMDAWVESRNPVADGAVSDLRVAAGALLILTPLRGRAAAGPSPGYVRVGRWMSTDELAKMRNAGVVQEGSGGLTFVANSGASSFRSQARNGSVYVEFDLPANSLLQGGRADWFKTIGPGAPKSQLFKLRKQGGVTNPAFENLSNIIESK